MRAGVAAHKLATFLTDATSFVINDAIHHAEILFREVDTLSGATPNSWPAFRIRDKTAHSRIEGFNKVLHDVTKKRD